MKQQQEHIGEAPSPQEGRFALTPKQQLAIEHLAAGHAVVEAAELVGVDRTTVHRWLRGPAFEAALNSRCRELHRVVQLQLAAMAEKAAENVAEAVGQGDLPTSQFYLKHLLPRAVPSREAEDAKYLRAIAALQEREQKVREQERRLEEAESILIEDGFIAMLEQLYPGEDVRGEIRRNRGLFEMLRHRSDGGSPDAETVQRTPEAAQAGETAEPPGSPENGNGARAQDAQSASEAQKAPEGAQVGETALPPTVPQSGAKED